MLGARGGMNTARRWASDLTIGLDVSGRISVQYVDRTPAHLFPLVPSVLGINLLAIQILTRNSILGFPASASIKKSLLRRLFLSGGKLGVC
jgi:hypothetical protein